MLEAQLRKYQDIMTAAGRGVFVLGIWSVIKLILTLNLTPSGEEVALQPDTVGGFIVSLVVYSILFGIELLYRGYIWRCTEAESKGISKGRKFMFACGLLVFLYVISILGSVALSIYVEGDGWTRTVASIIIDITALSMLIEIMHCVKKVRKIKKEGAL